MKESNKDVATKKDQEGGALISALAKQWNVEGIDKNKLYKTLKNTAFKPVKKGSGFITATDEQLTALIIVCKQYNLNPFLKEVYAFPAKDGSIVPVVGVDGWSRIVNDHKDMDGISFNQSEVFVTPKGGKRCPEWIECVIHRKDRSKPIIIREYLDECYKEAAYSTPWQTHTKRFLRHKALIQAARLAFGFAGIHDLDEGERIVEMKNISEINVTNEERLAKINEEFIEKTDDEEKVAADNETLNTQINDEHGLIKVESLLNDLTQAFPADRQEIFTKSGGSEILKKLEKDGFNELAIDIKKLIQELK